MCPLWPDDFFLFCFVFVVFLFDLIYLLEDIKCSAVANSYYGSYMKIHLCDKGKKDWEVGWRGAGAGQVPLSCGCTIVV